MLFLHIVIVWKRETNIISQILMMMMMMLLMMTKVKGGNKKGFCILSKRGLDTWHSCGTKKKEKDFFPQNCKFFCNKEDSKSLQNIKPQKKRASFFIIVSPLIAPRNSFATQQQKTQIICNSIATQQQKTQIICNSKAKKLCIFWANVPKAKKAKVPVL